MKPKEGLTSKHMMNNIWVIYFRKCGEMLNVYHEVINMENIFKNNVVMF